MSNDAYHCTGCYYSTGPVRTDPDGITCCTCCGGPGRNDGGGW